MLDGCVNSVMAVRILAVTESMYGYVYAPLCTILHTLCIFCY